MAERFLDRFLPDREPLFDAFDPIEVLGLAADSSLSDILEYLEAQPTARYSMYWRNVREEPPYGGILAFTADGALILGLSPCNDERASEAEKWIDLMKQFTDSEHAYWGVEEAPADSSSSFKSRAAFSTGAA